MSTLVTDRLDSESPVLTQVITPEHDITVGALRAFLYIHGMPAGTFYFRFYLNGVSVKEYSFTAASAKTAINTAFDYFAIYLSLAGDVKLAREEYELRLESSGYTFTEEAWIGWNKDWNKLDSLSVGVPSGFSEYPYSYKLIEYAAREF